MALEEHQVSVNVWTKHQLTSHWGAKLVDSSSRDHDRPSEFSCYLDNYSGSQPRSHWLLLKTNTLNDDLSFAKSAGPSSSNGSK